MDRGPAVFIGKCVDARAAPLPKTWIFTGDEGVAIAPGRFGEWAIHRLLEKEPPDSIGAAFQQEVKRNRASYDELLPVFGIAIDKTTSLADGVSIDAQPIEQFAALNHRIPFRFFRMPEGASVLRIAYTVEPAFEHVDREPRSTSVAIPDWKDRDTLRERVRLFCLLASSGPVELPVSVLAPDPTGLFVAGHGNKTARSNSAHPRAPIAVTGAAIKRFYDQLGAFRGINSMGRAVDRLGRSRLATSPVDRALDLGMAAEIVLMHDHSPANTEISNKIGRRAARLLGVVPEDRARIPVAMRELYQARSQAVHSGFLSLKSKVDLESADRLVTEVFRLTCSPGISLV